MELRAVFAAASGEAFLGLPVRGLEELVPHDFDRIVITFFDTPEATAARVEELLRRGVSHDQIVTLQ